MPFGEAEATENPAAVASPVVGEVHRWWLCTVVVMMMVVCGLKLLKFEPEAAAFCGLVLVFGSKLVSCDAAGLPFGMVSEPRRRLEPTLAGGLVEYLAVKMYFRVSAEFLELCQRASTRPEKLQQPRPRRRLLLPSPLQRRSMSWLSAPSSPLASC